MDQKQIGGEIVLSRWSQRGIDARVTVGRMKPQTRERQHIANSDFALLTSNTVNSRGPLSLWRNTIIY